MKSDLPEILDRCLDALARGKTVEESLAPYPDSAAELAPLLLTGATLRGLPRQVPRPPALDAALLRAGASLPRRNGAPEAGPALRPGNGRLQRVGRVAFRWATAAALSLVLVAGIGTVSAHSAPGDLLYPLKLATERVTFSLTFSPEKRAELRLSFADDRLDELVRRLQASGAVDPALLRILLREAELALNEAGPVQAEHYKLFLAKLGAFNTYQRSAFQTLGKKARGEDAQLLRRAISVCDERDRWIQERMTSPEGEKEGGRCWGGDCEW